MKTAHRMLFYAASNLGPYHLIRFNTLARYGVDLTVAQTPIKEFLRPWQFDADQAKFKVEQPYRQLEKAGISAVVHATRRYFAEKKPDVVVLTGYNRKFNWAALYVCRQFNIPAYLYLVGWAEERRRVFFKEIAKKWMCRYFSGALVTGVRAQAYAQELGISEDKIWRIGNVIDNQHFARGRQSPPFMPPDTPPYFLVVSRLSPEKNLDRLLYAFARYKQMGGEWALVIAGTGPEEENLKRLKAQLSLSDAHFPGWVSYTDLPALYAHAHCFALPSVIEPWGLVVNEAMAAGLPVLVSRTCGCMPELCWRGINGYDFDPTDVEQMAMTMRRFSATTTDWRKMGLYSQAIISHFSLDNWAAVIMDMLDREINGGGLYE